MTNTVNIFLKNTFLNSQGRIVGQYYTISIAFIQKRMLGKIHNI